MDDNKQPTWKKIDPMIIMAAVHEAKHIANNVASDDRTPEERWENAKDGLIAEGFVFDLNGRLVDWFRQRMLLKGKKHDSGADFDGANIKMIPHYGGYVPTKKNFRDEAVNRRYIVVRLSEDKSEAMLVGEFNYSDCGDLENGLFGITVANIANL